MAGYTNYSGAILNYSSDYTQQLWASGTATLYGPNTPSKLTGSNQGNFLQGGSADDTLYVINVADRISGGAGVDTAYATVNFTLPSDVENLTVDGRWSAVTGVANDRANLITVVNSGVTVSGLGGDDVIFSSAAGGGTFVFGPGSGQDTVVGFKTGSDTVRLSGYDFDTFAEVKAAMSQVGGDTLLKLSPTDLVLFKGASVSSFSADDFQLSINVNSLKLTFADEFDTLRLKVSGASDGWATAYDWDRYQYQSAHTIPGESSIYVDATFAGAAGKALGLDPFSVSGGVLSITAAKTSAEAKAALWGHDYTSGLITTSGTFAQTYGYFEMRADLPSGKGAFPAFWLLPQDGSYTGEIDVMEMVNGGDQMWNHIHFDAEDGDREHQGFSTNVANLTEGFHTFGVLWTEETITWFVDGTAVNAAATPASMHTPMYMLANYAVGGSWAGAPDGSPLSDMKIDYIRAYSLEGGVPQMKLQAAPTASSYLSIAADTATVTEGSGGTSYAVLTVTRTGDLGGPATAKWSVAGAGANAADAADFGGQLPTGQVFFGGGESTKTIWVAIAGDKTAEFNETFVVSLGESTGAAVATGSATVTIQNDDGAVIVPAKPDATPPPGHTPGGGALLSISANAATVVEGAGGTQYALFTVTRSGDLSGPSTATWTVSGSGASAANAADFGGAFPSDKVFFGAGESAKTIWVPFSGDTAAEANETFTVTLTGATGGSVATATAAATILNDDGALPAPAAPVVTAPAPIAPPSIPSSGPTLSVAANSPTYVEGAGVGYALFTVTRGGDLSGPSSAQWAVKGAGANAATAADFQGGALPGGMVFFGGGETTKTIWVAIAGGDGAEANEGFGVYLSNPSGAGLGSGEATAVIIDPIWSGNGGFLA